MSAPRFVNTTDGLCWTRREVTRDGVELYALEAVKVCPAHLMETYAELVERGIAGSADVLPVPVGPEPQELRADRAVGEPSPGGYPPALPWLALLDEDDRVEFLDELADSATVNQSSDVRLAEIERTCATWRLIAEAQHGHNTAPGPDAEPYVSRLLPPRDVICARTGCGHRGEDHHHGDTKCWAHLPKQLGDPITICGCAGFMPGPSVGESAPRCRCGEPDADPYACEAEPEDCSGEFSELNPFGGGPVHGHDAKVSRPCGQCEFRTSLWHVDDGSAEEELHRHVVRVHGVTGGA